MSDPQILVQRATRGCDSTRVFLIHDDDSGSISAHACEHEVLTD
jgi:hypothetical protein